MITAEYGSDRAAAAAASLTTPGELAEMPTATMTFTDYARDSRGRFLGACGRAQEKAISAGGDAMPMVEILCRRDFSIDFQRCTLPITAPRRLFRILPDERHGAEVKYDIS